MPRGCLVAAIALGCALVPAAGAGAARPGCAKSLSVAEIRLPAPVRVTTSCAVYTVFPDGHVSASARVRSRAAGITWMVVAGAAAPVVQDGGRIAVLRAGRVIWRSSRRFAVGGVFATVGRAALAFSYERYDGRRPRVSLYVAALGGREHAVAGDERPLGWTRSGELLTWQFRQGIGVHLRAADGRLIRRVGGRLRDIRFDPSTRAVVALTREGVLKRFAGVRWTRVNDLRALGLARTASLELLDAGLLGVRDRTRIAVLRHDGSVFATARFPRTRRGSSIAAASGLVAESAGSAVAFAVTRGNDGYRSTGVESVYVLRAGDSRARRVYSHRLRFAVCERGVGLSWRGDWLLYSTTEGRTIALKTRSPRRMVTLTPLVRRLAPVDGEGKTGADVDWA